MKPEHYDLKKIEVAVSDDEIKITQSIDDEFRTLDDAFLEAVRRLRNIKFNDSMEEK